MTIGLVKEAQRGYSIPFGGQQEVDDLAVGINGSVQILPLAFDFDIGFIHSPPTPPQDVYAGEKLYPVMVRNGVPSVRATDDIPEQPLQEKHHSLLQRSNQRVRLRGGTLEQASAL